MSHGCGEKGGTAASEKGVYTDFSCCATAFFHAAGEKNEVVQTREYPHLTLPPLALPRSNMNIMFDQSRTGTVCLRACVLSVAFAALVAIISLAHKNVVGNSM